MPDAIQAAWDRLPASLQRAARRMVSRFGASVPVRLRTGDVLFVDVSNTVGRSILLRREYGGEMQALLESRLKPGSVFCDVGANVGYYSLFASRLVGNDGQVFAFEPNPDLVPLLRRSVRFNHRENVAVLPVGVGRASSVARLQVMRSSGVSFVGDPSDVRAEDRPRGSEWIPVMRLDDALRGHLSRLDLLKIDVEGRELDVLEGARETLETHRPAVVIEVAPTNLSRFGTGPEQILGFFESLGYRGGRFGKPWGPGGRDADYLFEPRS